MHPARRTCATFVLCLAAALPAAAQIPPVLHDPLRQGGFEVPDLGTGMGAYAYAPAGSAWTFAGATGLAGNYSGFTHENPVAPQGDQVLFVQGGTGSTVRQSFAIAAGRYRLRVRAAQRVQGGVPDSQSVRLRIDGVTVATMTPSDGSYAWQTSDSFQITVGSHTLEIAGLNGQGDNTALLDDLKLESFAAIGDPWSDPATWPGGIVPGPTSAAVIPAGQIVVLDTLGAQVQSLVVDGELHCADKNISLAAEWIMVHGRFECGSVASPYLHDAELTLVGADDGDNIMQMGDKLLGVMGSGVVELHGAPRVGWTQLDATAPAGATTLTLAAAVDWAAGDRIVVAPTGAAYHEGEVVTIQSVSADGRTLAIAPPLAFAHWGQQATYQNATTSWTLDERAEVGLLTRNITIQGDDQSTAAGFGGHMMSMAGTSVRTSGVEFYRMGQRGKLGRYPFHWHLVQSAPGQYIKNSSIHRSWNRCVTVHGTHDTLVADNVCYDFIGHGYFLEDGIEQRNVFDHNLGVWAKKPLPAQALLETDYRDEPASNGPAVFWIGHPDNVYTRNAAAGSEGTGFWYGMKDHVSGDSYTQQLPGWDINPRTAPFGTFDDNRVHSSRQGFSSCRDGGGPAGMQPPDSDPAIIVGLTATNVGQGVWPCSYPMDEQNATFRRMIVANTINGMQAPNPMTFEDSLFVSYSANAPAAAAATAGLDWHAINVYDQGFLLDNVHFVNYDRPAHTIFQPGSGAHKLVNNRGAELSFDNSPNLFLDAAENGQLGAGPAEWGDVFHDLDGSFVGQDRAAVNDHPLMYDRTCTQPTHLRHAGYVCPYRYAHFRTESHSPISEVTMQRSDGVHVTSGHIEMRHINEFIVDGEYFYTYRHLSGMKHEQVWVELYNAFPGDAPVYEFLDVPATVAIATSGWSVAPSLRQLFEGPGRRWYWREGSLFLKLLAAGQPWHAHDLVVVCPAGVGNCDLGQELTLDLPAVAITSPADGARVPAGPFTVTATADGGDDAIAEVRLYVGTAKKGTDTTPPYVFNVTGVTAGSYPLKVVAQDVTGQTYTALQQIHVGDALPRVEITSHADHQSFDTAQAIQLAFDVQNWSVGAGGDHLHWFINDVDQGHLYTTAPLTVSNLAQGRQEIKVALARADETVLAVNDVVVLYGMTGGVVADFEDGPDRRTTLGPEGPVTSEIAYAWGTAQPVASRLDPEDDINWYDVRHVPDGVVQTAVWRLGLAPAQDWTARTFLEIHAGALPWECWLIDATQGATLLGSRTGPVTTLPLPAAARKDEVVAIELRTPESLVPAGTSERNHVFRVRVGP